MTCPQPHLQVCQTGYRLLAVLHLQAIRLTLRVQSVELAADQRLFQTEVIPGAGKLVQEVVLLHRGQQASATGVVQKKIQILVSGWIGRQLAEIGLARDPA